MEFPSRTGGAQGGLIKGNLFAQSGMPAFSHTRHGDAVIHTVNGRIAITRDQAGGLPPYLMCQLYLDGVLGTKRAGIEADVQALETFGDTPAAGQDWRSGNGVFVGDGYFLCLRRNAESTAARPALINIDDPEAPAVDSRSADNVAGANVFFDVPYLMERTTGAGCLFPSVMACGWRDSARRYGFAVFGILVDGTSILQSRYVCFVGDTGTRSVRMIDLPTLPDSPYPVLVYGDPDRKVYKTSWWGVETCDYRTYYSEAEGTTLDPGPARCYCIAPGHLVTVLMPQERLDVPPDAQGGYTIHPNRLPAGSAPRLLRSRDFGETWSIESADFLIADDPPAPDPLFDGTPTQRVSWQSMFIAAPFGDGRVALAAHGKSLGSFSYEVAENENFASAHRAWRFYVADSHGSGFRNVPWPLDQMRGYFESVLDLGGEAERSYEYPLFYPDQRAARAYSFGPGNFTICAMRSHLSVPGLVWGSYPQDYPVTAWMTGDYGLTWTAHLVPDSCKPYATRLQELKDAYGMGTGNGSQLSDGWALNWFKLGFYEPAVPAGAEAAQPPLVTVMTHDVVGPLLLCASTDAAAPVESLAPIKEPSSIDITVAADPTNIYAEFSRVPYEWFYTGDALNPMYPELVYPGYPEFEVEP